MSLEHLLLSWYPSQRGLSGGWAFLMSEVPLWWPPGESPTRLRPSKHFPAGALFATQGHENNQTMPKVDTLVTALSTCGIVLLLWRAHHAHTRGAPRAPCLKQRWLCCVPKPRPLGPRICPAEGLSRSFLKMPMEIHEATARPLFLPRLGLPPRRLDIFRLRGRSS